MASRKDVIETEQMLGRLQSLGIAREDAEALRRISMTLHRWHELECNEDIQLGKLGPAGGFVHDEKGAPYLVRQGGNGEGNRYWRIPNREAGARKRLKAILARYSGLTGYIQGDPRGCALYIIRPGDVPEGADVSSCYSRGIAVYR